MLDFETWWQQEQNDPDFADREWMDHVKAAFNHTPKCKCSGSCGKDKHET